MMLTDIVDLIIFSEVSSSKNIDSAKCTMGWLKQSPILFSTLLAEYVATISYSTCLIVYFKAYWTLE